MLVKKFACLHCDSRLVLIWWTSQSCWSMSRKILMTLNAGTQLGNYHNIMTSLSASLFLVQPAHLRAVADIGSSHSSNCGFVPVHARQSRPFHLSEVLLTDSSIRSTLFGSVRTCPKCDGSSCRPVAGNAWLRYCVEFASRGRSADHSRIACRPGCGI